MGVRRGARGRRQERGVREACTLGIDSEVGVGARHEVDGEEKHEEPRPVEADLVPALRRRRTGTEPQTGKR